MLCNNQREGTEYNTEVAEVGQKLRKEHYFFYPHHRKRTTFIVVFFSSVVHPKHENMIEEDLAIQIMNMKLYQKL